MELKEFCDFAGVEYQRILQHSNAKFLSLLHALGQALEMLHTLKCYFYLQEQCPIIITQGV